MHNQTQIRSTESWKGSMRAADIYWLPLFIAGRVPMLEFCSAQFELQGRPMNTINGAGEWERFSSV